MSDIELCKPHSLPIATAKARVQKAADGLIAEYGLSSEWDGNTLHFHRSGVDCQILVTGSEIRLTASLGFLLKPMKATLVSRIERDFDQFFPEPVPGVRAKRPVRETV